MKLNITNNDDEVLSLEALQVERIEDLISSIKTNGTVSRNEVLSLENFLGMTIVTKDINPNKIADIPTHGMATEVVTILEETISKSNIKGVITYTDLVEIVTKVNYTLKSILNTVKSFSNIDTDENSKINKLRSKEFRYRYSDDVLVDIIADEPINFSLRFDLDKLADVFGENFKDFIENKNIQSDTMFPLISILKNKELHTFFENHGNFKLEVVTFQDIIDIITSPTDVIKDITDLMEIVDNDIYNIREKCRWYMYNQKDVVKKYNIYKHLANIICDDELSGSLMMGFK